LLAGVSNARSSQRNGKDNEQGQEHAQIAYGHNEGHGRTGQRSAKIDAPGKPGQQREPGGDGNRGEETSASGREFAVVQDLEDSQDCRSKSERKNVRDPEWTRFVQSFLRAPNGPAPAYLFATASIALCAIVHKKGLRQNKARRTILR
jgi:hypothetical protein